MLKRIADWMEKFSAGSMLIGVFQINFYAITLGVIALGVVLGLQRYLQRREKWQK